VAWSGNTASRRAGPFTEVQEDSISTSRAMPFVTHIRRPRRVLFDVMHKPQRFVGASSSLPFYGPAGRLLSDRITSSAVTSACAAEIAFS